MTEEGKSGVDREIALGVLIHRGRHRTHDGEIIGALANVRENVADGEATLTMVGKLEGRTKNVANTFSLSWLQLVFDLVR